MKTVNNHRFDKKAVIRSTNLRINQQLFLVVTIQVALLGYLGATIFVILSDIRQNFTAMAQPQLWS